MTQETKTVCEACGLTPEEIEKLESSTCNHWNFEETEQEFEIIEILNRVRRDSEWTFYVDYKVNFQPEEWTDSHDEVIDDQTNDLMEDNRIFHQAENFKIVNGCKDYRDDNIIRFYFDIDNDTFPAGDLEY